MQKISPFLWFGGQAEEAMNFYTSIFKNSKVREVQRYGGGVMGGTFELEGQEFMALNGGPEFKFSPAISFFVHCETQEEIDDLWDKLSAGGQTEKCGWLRDKYGVSWQIVPNILGELLGDKDAAKASNVMNAMMQMVKLDIHGLKQASEKTPVTK